MSNPPSSPSLRHVGARSADQQMALLASIVSSSEDAIYSESLDGVILTWNHAAEEIYGFAEAEIVGQPVTRLVPADRVAEMMGALERIGSGQRVAPYESFHARKDGKIISVALSMSPVHDAGGKVVAASSIARDITERKRADEQILAASQYARSLIEASLDPLVTISPEGKITDVNEATVKITGVLRDRLIATDFSDYFTRPEQAREGYQQVFSQGSVTDYPLTIRHQDGRLTDVLYNATVYRDPEGNVRGVFAAARDVTEQKAASQYARSLIEASLDPLVTISAEGKITDVNEATIKITGFEREQLIGTDFSVYFTEPEKAREGYLQVFSQGFVTDYPLTIRHRDARLTNVLYNASVFKDVAGNVLGVFAAARDVTAQKRAEAEVADQRTKELDRLAELERFQKLTVGRELKMIELKKEIEELKGKLPHRSEPS